MTKQTLPDVDFCFDILRGLARLTDNRLIGDLASVVAALPRADLSIAFNHKQIGCKLWLRECLFEALGGSYERIWILGGWYGVLAALLFDDARFTIGSIKSFDIDPDCAAVASLLNCRAVKTGRFEAMTQDMRVLDYQGGEPPSLVINTSCEHLDDVVGWLASLPNGTPVVLQSNDYWREPDHVSCIESLAAFEAQAGLSEVRYRGTHNTKRYNRFMLIGRR